MSFHLEITTANTEFHQDGDELSRLIAQVAKDVGHKVSLSYGGEVVGGTLKDSNGEPLGAWVYERAGKSHVVELKVELTMTEMDGTSEASAEIAEGLVQEALDENLAAENIGVYVTNHYEEG